MLRKGGVIPNMHYNTIYREYWKTTFCMWIAIDIYSKKVNTDRGE